MNLKTKCVIAFAAILPFAATAKEKGKTVLGSQTENVSSVINTEEEQNAISNSSETDYTKKQAVVVVKKSTVLRGGKYEADIIMLHPSPQCTYTTYINKNKIENGRYSKLCNAVGKMRYKGYVLETDNKGTTQQFPFEGEYQVTEPFCIISKSTMDVVYEGIDNYLDIRVPGFSISDLQVTVTNASIYRTNRGFKIEPKSNVNTCKVIVSVMIDGKNTCIGVKSFKILPLPTPKAYLTDSDSVYADGTIEKDALMDANEVVAKCESKDLFDEELRFVILRFDMKIYGNKDAKVYHSESGIITNQMKDALSKLKKGETVYFTNVVSKGKDGKLHKLSPIEIIIK